MNTNIFLTLALGCFFSLGTAYAGGNESLADGLGAEGEVAANRDMLGESFVENLNRLTLPPGAAEIVDGLKVNGQLKEADFDSLVKTFGGQMSDQAEQTALVLAMVFQDEDGSKETFHSAHLALVRRLQGLLQLKESGEWTPQAEAQEMILLNMVGNALLIGGKGMDSESLYLLYATVSMHISDMIKKGLREGSGHRKGIMNQLNFISIASHLNVKRDYIGEQTADMMSYTIGNFSEDLKDSLSKRLIFRNGGFALPPAYDPDMLRSIFLETFLLEKASEQIAQQGKLKLERVSQLKTHISRLRRTGVH